MDQSLLGYCGLYCGGCPMYQATVAGTPKKDEKGDDLVCKGCDSGRTTPWCTDCQIKACNKRKGIRYCLECADNPCEILTYFMNDPQYPYHLEVQDNMKSLKELGFERWASTSAQKYRCGSCRSQVNWFEASCSKCGVSLR